MRIVLCYPVEREHIAQIAGCAPGSEIVDAGQERVAVELLEADVFCGHPKVPVPWMDVVQRGRLRWIQSSAAGLDHCLVPPVIDSEIVVTSASGVLADQVAEHTVALLTATLRSLPVFFRAQQAKQYARRPTRDLHHSTVGIVGFGGVGRRVAEVLAPFKTRILATDWFPVRQPPHVQHLWPADQLARLLSESDIVVLCVPLTDKTRGMIDSRAFQSFKPGAVLINVSRGPVVVERDMLSALDEGWITSAAVDVTEQEPLPPTSPLWDHPNVIITPHVAGQSARRIDAMTDFFCDNLRRFQGGEPLRNLVDKTLGFPVPDCRFE